ncbi:MAG: zinc-binding dehydrogenase [Dehalococcoidales bacterium]|nr:zinc-binding dehydrogenase [Dehalococcoidales bacterium]
MSGEKGKAMVSFAPGIPWEMREYPVPDPEPDAVVARITMSSICGSDIHMYKGDFGGAQPGVKPKPRIAGHEFVGRIYKLGSNVKTDFMGQPLKEGDRVAWCYFLPCGRCPCCLNETAIPCPERHKHAGTTSDDWPHFKGAFAEYYYISPGQWIYKIPDAVPDEAAVYVDCAASTVAYALHKTTFPMGSTTVIQGAGGLGLNAAPMAKDMGAARVIVIDKLPERLKLAGSFGADYTIDYNEYVTPKARIERVKQLTGGNGASLVMEVVASAPEVVPEGLEMLSLGGTYLTVGLVGPFTTQLSMGPFINKGIRLIGSANYKAWTMPRVLDFMARNIHRYPFDKIISHKFKLQDAEEAMKQAAAGKVVRAAVVID